MTGGGWVIMGLSVGFVTGLLAWCIHRVVGNPQATEKFHSQVDIDTRDKD